MVEQFNKTLSWKHFIDRHEEMIAFHRQLHCPGVWLESAKEHCTFHAGGRIGLLLLPETEEHILELLKITQQLHLPLFFMGNGSNLLVRDGGFPGIIVKLAENFSGIDIIQRTATILAGTSLKDVARETAKANLKGLDFAVDIPGTIGGALFMNAGMYEETVGQVVENVWVIERTTGKVKICSKENCCFGYRQSVFQQSGDIIIKAQFHLEEGSYGDLKIRMHNIQDERRAKFPLEFPNAGSIFKRPPGNYAGSLIEKAHLKGMRQGGAQISEKHAGFIINIDNATASDIENLILRVQQIIGDTFNITLETEIRLLGISPEQIDVEQATFVALSNSVQGLSHELDMNIKKQY